MADKEEVSSSIIETPRPLSKRAKQAAPIITKIDNCIEGGNKALMVGGGEEVTDTSCRRPDVSEVSHQSDRLIIILGRIAGPMGSVKGIDDLRGRDRTC